MDRKILGSLSEQFQSKHSRCLAEHFLANHATFQKALDAFRKLITQPYQDIPPLMNESTTFLRLSKEFGSILPKNVWGKRTRHGILAEDRRKMVKILFRKREKSHLRCDH